ncbi:MAG TPA: 50S ribosomal protein L22 [bacterium]|jgi:large subunit ribosomal protein L22|nr:50S ribosomal protein L22 [bacterium]
MEAKAVARYVRIAPRKVRVVLDLVRGKSVQEAMGILRFIPKRGAGIIEKLLQSAMANAENNLDLNPMELYVTRAFADEGPTLKRYRPRARGQAYPILKRTSHITVVVGEK